MVEVGAEFLLDIEDCIEQTCVNNFNNLIGGDLVEKIHSMEVTSDGGYILAGSSTSSNNGDIVDVNSGGEDFWVVKLDANAEIEWSNLFGDTTINIAHSIIQATDGNFVVVGQYGSDVRTIKLDNNGNEIWSYNYDKGSSQYLKTNIIETSTGNFVSNGCCGYFYEFNSAGDKVFDFRISTISNIISLSESNNGNYVVFNKSSSISRFEVDKWGEIVAERYYSTGTLELAEEASPTDDGGHIIGATLFIDEDNYDYLIKKTASNGSLEWEKTYGGEARDYIYSISQTNDNGYITVGYSESSNSGNVTKTNNGGKDFWTVKLDASGNLEWENLIGSNFNDEPRSIRQTTDGGYVVAGYSIDAIGGDIIDDSNGSTEGWFVKLDADGQIVQTIPCE